MVMRFIFVLMIALILCGCKERSNQNELNFLRTFATNFELDREDKLFKNLPDNFCKKVQNAFEVDSVNSLLYVNLILLKMYKGHLECCEQSYSIRPVFYHDYREGMAELNSRNCLFYNFIANSTAKDNKEFLVSSFVYMEIKNNPRLRDNQLFSSELLEIEKMMGKG